MDHLLARYLDGELSESEADELLRRAADDARFAQALHDHEAILSTAGTLSRPAAPSRLTDDVMAAIDRREHSSRPRGRVWFAAAAMLVLGVGLGFVGGRSIAPELAAARPSSSVILPASLTPAGEPGVAYLRAVRLAYNPTTAEVGRVEVAGSFNGWNPRSAPLSREGDVWTVLLVLPPGAHEYMFVEDGERWVTDPRAPQVRHDGFGGANGVLNVSL